MNGVLWQKILLANEIFPCVTVDCEKGQGGSQMARKSNDCYNCRIAEEPCLDRSENNGHIWGLYASGRAVGEQDPGTWDVLEGLLHCFMTIRFWFRIATTGEIDKSRGSKERIRSQFVGLSRAWLESTSESD